ncbi:hypothetical protein GGS20DRAFT_561358 [Poronia punctata]|nr:hypothetical protein GGS20DRAFT_561358 [Poronia punctata]
MNYTKTHHTAPYASIAPTRAALSAANKTVLIVGASSGIAQETARAFLEAGSASLVLVSRRTGTLTTFVSGLQEKYPAAEIQTLEAGVCDAEALTAAFSSVKSPVDVVINCAGYAPTLAPVAKSDLKDFWRGFEVNVLGPATLAQVIAARAPGATFLQLGTAGALFPAQMPMAGYATSKLALVKLMEYVGAENPGLRVVTVHPGVVPETEGGQKMVKESGVAWPGDDIKLPARFLVWAASDEASFLKNKFVFANWDVDEMKARAEEIAASPELTIGLNGFPRNVE